MSKSNDGGPAFPHREYESRPFYHGMSKREWFAGQALSGLLANTIKRGNEDNYAHDAVVLADALIAELNKEPTQ